ncbi:hypothetical protein ACFWAR_05430 [Streptomyces sp. NPDC059917]|uniref:hypothetical protein n=1 Tax=Streptomyces sp. NPDC059917 TaxID=3347002 RepID=UPI0036553002
MLNAHIPQAFEHRELVSFDVGLWEAIPSHFGLRAGLGDRKCSDQPVLGIEPRAQNVVAMPHDLGVVSQLRFGELRDQDEVFGRIPPVCCHIEPVARPPHARCDACKAPNMIRYDPANLQDSAPLRNRDANEQGHGRSRFK